MYDALFTFFNFVNTELVNPLADAMNDTDFMYKTFNFLVNFIRSLLKLWNNDNVLDFNLNDYTMIIAEILGALFVILIIKLSISIVNVFISTIKGVLK